eukprot:6116063-Amphidinium_carterae.1
MELERLGEEVHQNWEAPEAGGRAAAAGFGVLPPERAADGGPVDYAVGSSPLLSGFQLVDSGLGSTCGPLEGQLPEVEFGFTEGGFTAQLPDVEFGFTGRGMGQLPEVEFGFTGLPDVEFGFTGSAIGQMPEVEVGFTGDGMDHVPEVKCGFTGSGNCALLSDVEFGSTGSGLTLGEQCPKRGALVTQGALILSSSSCTIAKALSALGCPCLCVDVLQFPWFRKSFRERVLQQIGSGGIEFVYCSIQGATWSRVR